MNEEEGKKYVDTIMSMSLDLQLGHVSWEMYLKNLEWIVKKLTEKSKEPNNA